MDEISTEVDKVMMKIFKRESNEHDRRMFDIKFEYGFREQKKANKLRGGKTVKKKEKKKMINTGGGGAKDKKREKFKR